MPSEIIFISVYFVPLPSLNKECCLIRGLDVYLNSAGRCGWSSTNNIPSAKLGRGTKIHTPKYYLGEVKIIKKNSFFSINLLRRYAYNPFAGRNSKKFEKFR